MKINLENWDVSIGAYIILYYIRGLRMLPIRRKLPLFLGKTLISIKTNGTVSCLFFPKQDVPGC